MLHWEASRLVWLTQIFGSFYVESHTPTPPNIYDKRVEFKRTKYTTYSYITNLKVTKLRFTSCRFSSQFQ
jgi:hypothetical protein